MKCIKWGIPLEEYMGSKEACQGAQPVTANARMCEILHSILAAG